MSTFNNAQFFIAKCDHPQMVTSFRSNFYGLNQPYKFQVVYQSNQEIPFNNGQHAVLSYQYNGINNYVHGIISDMIISHCLNDCLQYEITLNSPLFLLMLSQTNRIFVHQTVIEIIQIVLKERLPHFVFYEFNLEKTYHQQSLIVQYQETDFQFLMRLLNQYQLWFYVDQKKTDVKYIFCDHFIAEHDSLQVLNFVDLSGMVHSQNTIFDLKVDFGNSQLQEKILFKTDYLGLQPGQVVKIEQHPIKNFNQCYRLTHLSINSNKPYITCKAIPVKQHFLMSNILKPKHLILPAIIKDIDTQNGYTIQFYFDKNHQDVNGVRHVQYYGGKNYGINFPLPINAEVAVGFEEGNIDCPIILGALNHPFTPNVVYDNNSTENRIRTTGGHEICFDDRPNHEQIDIHTKNRSQRFSLNANAQVPSVQFSNDQGDLNLYAFENIKMVSEKDQLLIVDGHHKVTIGYEQTFMTEEGHMLMHSNDNVYLYAHQGVCFQSLMNHLCIKSNETTLIGKSIELISNHNYLDVKAKSDMTLEGKKCYIVSNDKLEIGSSITIHKGNLHFSKAIFNAPNIVLQPSIPTE